MRLIDPQLAHALCGAEPEDLAACTLIGVLPDGRVCAVKPLLFHWTMLVDLNWAGQEDRYCYANRVLAEAAIGAWNGDGDPEGWHRHLRTGRRRDLATGREWVAW